MLTTDASPQGWGATLIHQNQIELIQRDCRNEKEAEMTSNAKEIKAIYYGLLRFEQVFKKMQDQAVLIRSDNTTAVYDIGKWKVKESLTERIKQVFYLVKRLKLQITTINIPDKLNSTTDSLSRLCRSGDYSLKDVMIQMISKTWNWMQIKLQMSSLGGIIKLHATDRHIRNTIQQTNQQLCNSGSQRSGDTLPQRIQLQMEQSQTTYPSTNISIKQSITENEVGQSTVNNNSTDLAGTIVVHQTKEFIHQIPFPWISRQDSGDWTENDGQGSKTSTRQCGRLPSGSVADVGRDLLKRFMKMRGFSEDGVNLLFKGQRFNTVKRDFYYLALLQDWLDTERITIEEMMKKDAEVILTEVTAFHTRQNNSVASAKSHKIEDIKTSGTSKYYLTIGENQNRTICFFRPNEIAEIRLKFSNVDKTENQASLRLAPKQANAIETYEVYETDNESLSPKLAIYIWIDRLKKQFPKGADFLQWHKGFNKPTTTKDISLQLTKLLRELKIIGASAYSIRHSATTELAKLGIPERDLATFTHHSQNSRTVQKYYIFASSIRANEIARQLTNNPGHDNE
ncbi:MAG: hypothetical protein EZS28_033495, partial [Streblomastix strix]